MRSTNERMELLKMKTGKLKQRRKNKMLTALSYAACFGIVAAMSAFAAFDMQPVSIHKSAAENTASIFTDTQFFGYISVGILAFLLGISVTLLCSLLHKRNKEERRDGGADR